MRGTRPPTITPGSVCVAGAAGWDTTPVRPASRVVKDQPCWSSRVKTRRAARARDRMYTDALKSRPDALTGDVVDEADPVQPRTIGGDRQKAIELVDRLKNQIPDNKKALAGFDQEARCAGVPPGWLW